MSQQTRKVERGELTVTREGNDFVFMSFFLISTMSITFFVFVFDPGISISFCVLVLLQHYSFAPLADFRKGCLVMISFEKDPLLVMRYIGVYKVPFWCLSRFNVAGP